MGDGILEGDNILEGDKIREGDEMLDDDCGVYSILSTEELIFRKKNNLQMGTGKAWITTVSNLL